ncbi:MAG TPA: hypothetical protein DDW27_09805 [Bacteroidales bacterium]|nr:hypothetical protein [Bacteroidales bacterium]
MVEFYYKKRKIMKRFKLFIITVLSSITLVFSQNFDDALRYSQLFYGGTARFMSMGGAFTALGGDISALNQNPAGLGLFRSSEISVTPQLFHIKTTSDFNGLNTDFLYNFNLNQAGMVANIINRKGESGLLSLNFGYTYTMKSNLNQNGLIKGISNNSSMADYWADISYGYYKEQLYDNVADADLAYWAGLIDTLPGYSREYGSIFWYYGDSAFADYGQTVRRLISTDGSTSDHSFAIGGNYSNKIYFGLTLGISRIYYVSHYEHLETAGEVTPYGFDNFNYALHYENTGTGFSVKLGAIFRPTETFRIGLAFHSPTLYRIDEYVHDNITSNFTDGENRKYENNPSRYNYALTTPFRALAGVAAQIGKIGLVSADYEFVDYTAARFSQTGDGYDYSEKNLAIKNSLRRVSNIRLGAEMRYNHLYLRGGYGYYGKTFAQGDINQNLDYSTFSVGTGFREQNVFVDFGFTRQINSQKYVLYQSSAGNAISNLSIGKNMFTLTFGYKFGY